MKIVTTQLEGRYGPIILAAKSLLKDCHIWHPNTIPTYDMIDYMKPDIVMFDLKFVDSTLAKVTQKYPHIKWVLFGNGVPTELRPNLVCAPPELSSVIRKHVESGEHKTVYLHDCANLVTVSGGTIKGYLKCDFAYHSFNSDPRIIKGKIETFHKAAKLGKVLVLGSAKLPVNQYVGTIKESDVSSLYKSARACFDFNGEQLLDIAANGGYAISNVANKLFPDNPDFELSPSMVDIAKKAQVSVLNSDTCYHRLHIILKELQFQEADLVWQKIEQIQKDAVGL